MRIVDLTTATFTTLLRGGLGMRVGELGPRPQQPLELYEFEGCPFCRRVRETLSVLDLEAIVYPCPKGGHRFRDRVIEQGGKAQFPYLVDPNTGRRLYESGDITAYLFETYGEGDPPFVLSGNPLSTLLVAGSGLARGSAGSFVQASRAPEQPLELYSFEASPFCRLVRERLCELELPYRLHNVAKGSPGREAFVARSGKMQVPYLVDPNTGKALFESADIVDYLTATYAAD